MRHVEHYRKKMGVTREWAIYYFICDYVPNDAKTGQRKTRKASGLDTAHATAMAGFRRWQKWRPDPEWRQLYRDMIRSVKIEYSDSTRVEQADPVNASMIRSMHDKLPFPDQRGKRFYERCVMAQHLFRLMWQGMMRFGDIQHLDCKYISKHSKFVDGKRVQYLKLELQDKPRIGHNLWRVIHIPQREDILDCYELVMHYWNGRKKGPLFKQQPKVLEQCKTTFVAYLRKEYPTEFGRLKPHGIRAGSMNDCMDVAADERVVLLQGGWSSHSIGKELYNSFKPGYYTYIRLSPVLLRALATMGR